MSGAQRVDAIRVAHGQHAAGMLRMNDRVKE